LLADAICTALEALFLGGEGGVKQYSLRESHQLRRSEH
jgi:hypothetical protein